MITGHLITHSMRYWLKPTNGWIAEQIELLSNFNQQVLYEEKENPPSLDISSKTRYQFRLGPFRKEQKVWPNNSGSRLLFSHFGHQAWNDLSIRADLRIARFYGFEIERLVVREPIWKERYGELFQKADQIWVEGPRMLEKLKALSCEEGKLRIMPLGIHPKVRETKLKNGTFTILCGGTFKEKKGISIALNAIRNFVIASGLNQLKIHFIGNESGDAEDEEEVGRIKSEIRSPELQPFIIQHGFVSREKLHDLAVEADIGIFPSVKAKDGDCEGGYPLLLLEAMSQGLPLISTVHDDIPFVIRSDSGILCEERNSAQLTEALLHVYENRAERIEMGRKARKGVLNYFSWPKLQGRYEKEIQSLLNGRA